MIKSVVCLPIKLQLAFRNADVIHERVRERREKYMMVVTRPANRSICSFVSICSKVYILLRENAGRIFRFIESIGETVIRSSAFEWLDKEAGKGS
jgi:predicted oxidoreductase (fatty acid repression mutant protein)